jgi:hypothetical protein
MRWIPSTPIFLTKFLPLQKKIYMAKSNTSGSSRKISFGKRGTGKYKKSYGPKDQKPKKYRGQGR